MASAMCPHCKIILVEANNDFTNSLAAAVNRAAMKGANVISNSYGGPEAGAGPGSPAPTITLAWRSPPAPATTATTITGVGPPTPCELPATSSQFVTAVGGTMLAAPRTMLAGGPRSAWIDGGSGCSKFYPKPAWQHDTLCTKRMEADISAVGDPETGVAVYGPETLTKSSWGVFGGTSVGHAA